MTFNSEDSSDDKASIHSSKEATKINLVNNQSGFDFDGDVLVLTFN